MKNLVIGLAVTAILVSTVGCANGPLRRWLRGAPCNTCNPAIGQPLGENLIGGCNTGTCATGTCSNGAVGNGILGGMFRQNNQLNAPPSLPGNSFSDAQVGANTATDFYGNTTSAGKLEIPPSGPFN